MKPKGSPSKSRGGGEGGKAKGSQRGSSSKPKGSPTKAARAVKSVVSKTKSAAVPKSSPLKKVVSAASAAHDDANVMPWAHSPHGTVRSTGVPRSVDASDEDAVLTLLNLMSSPSHASPTRPKARQLFPLPQGDQAQAVRPGKRLVFSDGDSSGGGTKQSAHSPPPDKADKAKTVGGGGGGPTPKTPKKGVSKLGRSPKGKSPRSASKLPGCKTPINGRRAAGPREIKVTVRMSEVAGQLRHFVKNPAALRWCIYENFYSSIDRYETVPPPRPVPRPRKYACAVDLVERKERSFKQ